MAPIEVKVEANGRVLLPAEVRRALGVQPGDTLLLEIGDDGILLWTRDAAGRRLQALVSRHTPTGTSLVDELVAMRQSNDGTLDTPAAGHRRRRRHGKG